MDLYSIRGTSKTMSARYSRFQHNVLLMQNFILKKERKEKGECNTASHSLKGLTLFFQEPRVYLYY